MTGRDARRAFARQGGLGAPHDRVERHCTYGLILGAAIALAIHTAFSNRAPRLAEIGMADTVATAGGVDLGSDPIGTFYNPIAALRAAVAGRAVIVAAGFLARLATHAGSAAKTAKP